MARTCSARRGSPRFKPDRRKMQKTGGFLQVVGAVFSTKVDTGVNRLQFLGRAVVLPAVVAMAASLVAGGALFAGVSFSSADERVVLHVDNPAGDVRLKVSHVPDLLILHSTPEGTTAQGEVLISREGSKVRVRCRPSDSARIDLEIRVPYGIDIEARTQSGAISLEGTVRKAVLATDSGDVELRVPWAVTALRLDSNEKPEHVEIISRTVFQQSQAGRKKENAAWQLRDQLSQRRIPYGEIRVRTQRSSRIALKDLAIPKDSAVKMQWQAPELLATMVRDPAPVKPEDLRTSITEEPSPEFQVVDGVALFTSDVRMVNLDVSVVDARGHPIPGLGREDFKVVEDGVRQTVDFVGAEEVPFNLVLLLDCSGSTDDSREAIAETARRFAATARPQDRVAAYAIAGGNLHILSRLTTDRKEFNKNLQSISVLSGGTPLYDMVLLAYAEELAARRDERNALVVITDGLDNRLQGSKVGGQPSLISFSKLKEAAAGMNALIYPVFLDPQGENLQTQGIPRRLAHKWKRDARSRLTDLARISGGRVFEANSIRDLEPVYGQVSQELRSVYTLGYYPQNQKLDGSWKAVEVELTRETAGVRCREGYYAW